MLEDTVEDNEEDKKLLTLVETFCRKKKNKEVEDSSNKEECADSIVAEHAEKDTQEDRICDECKNKIEANMSITQECKGLEQCTLDFIKIVEEIKVKILHFVYSM